MENYPPARGPEDPFNPYAAPSASLRPSEDEFGYPPLAFGVSEIMARSWAIYQSRMAFCIFSVMGWAVLYVVTLLALGAILAALTGDAENSTGPAALLMNFVGTVVGTWFQVGLTILMLKVGRGRLASFGDIFTGGRYIVSTILASLVFGLAILAAIVVLMIPIGLAVAAMGRDPGTLMILTAVGVIFAVLLVAGLALRFWQFTYAIVDRGAGAMESLRISARATSGRWPSLLLIYLIALLINVAGALALVVGLIFTIPFSLVILAVTYTSLVEGPKTPAVPDGWRKPEPMLDF